MARAFRNIDRRLRRGFTLAESLIASVVLAAAVGGIVLPVIAAQAQAGNQRQSSAAVALANQLIEEISSKQFEDPSDGTTVLGPEADEVGRAAFDNYDDYHGYSDSTASMATLTGGTVAMGGEGTYTRSVRCEYRTTPSGAAAPGGDFLCVTVTVTQPNGKAVTVSQLFARFPKA